MAIKLNKILFPTDFSELSTVALKYAREFAELFSAQLYCLHVVDEGQQYWSAVGPEAAPICPPMGDILESANQQMQAFFDEHLVGLEYPAITHVSTTSRPGRASSCRSSDDNAWGDTAWGGVVLIGPPRVARRVAT